MRYLQTICHLLVSLHCRIARSGIIGSSRVRKMTSRDELLQKLLAETTDAIGNVAKGSKDYAKLLKGVNTYS